MFRAVRRRRHCDFGTSCLSVMGWAQEKPRVRSRSGVNGRNWLGSGQVAGIHTAWLSGMRITERRSTPSDSTRRSAAACVGLRIAAMAARWDKERPFELPLLCLA
ncbi:hypothetical protein FM111_14100 [Brevundimonas diminuta 3F5N]|uniref:Uncharacterized protein n=1 Tax=Brevundimonas diminuta 3F5N TaxID=1255603 RepID=A0A1R4GML5_BREDI|nr:hypothetical protein FM111_14100 [Brevundimonas diminuta 3F5N]